LLTPLLAETIEMMDFIKKIAKMDVELSVEERNLLSVAYKNVIGAKRSAWRIIAAVELKVRHCLHPDDTMPVTLTRIFSAGGCQKYGYQCLPNS
jgi:hypothetical protein